MRSILNEWQQFEKHLLLESPEALGYPQEIAKVFHEKFEGDTKHHKKFRHWLASQYKNNVNIYLLVDEDRYLEKVKRREEEINDAPEGYKEAYEKVMKETGVGYNHDSLAEYMKEEYDMRVNEFLDFYKKVKKAEPDDVLLFARFLREYFKDHIESFLRNLSTKVKNKKLLDIVEEKPSSAYKVVKNKDLNEAIPDLERWVDQHAYEKDKVIHKFDNGYFWYGPLTTTECEREGTKMGHCGRSGAQMYSLRDDDNNPHVTLEFNKEKNKVIQIKGKNNELPNEEYWDYIKAWFDYWKPEIDLQGGWSDTSRTDEEFVEFANYVTKDVSTEISTVFKDVKETLEEFKQERIPEQTHVDFWSALNTHYIRGNKLPDVLGNFEVSVFLTDLKFSKKEQERIEDFFKKVGEDIFLEETFKGESDFKVEGYQRGAILSFKFRKLVEHEKDAELFEGWLEEVYHQTKRDRVQDYLLDFVGAHELGTELSDEEKERMDDLVDQLTEQIRKELRSYAR